MFSSSVRTTTRFLLFAFLLSLLLSPGLVAASAGLNPPPGSERHLLFTPGLTRSLSFNVFGAKHIDVFLTGDLREYITIDDPEPNGSARAVKLILKLPEQLEPGKHVSYLYAREASPGGMIGARASVGVGISVLSLYPTPYLQAGLSVPNTAVSQPTVATLSLTSWSKVVTPDAWADLVVKDQRGAERLTTASQHVQVPAQGSQKVLVSLQTNRLEPGRYTVEALIHGAQPNLTATTSFKVGTLDLALRHYTKIVSAEKVNRFSFTIENRWNQPLHELYGDVVVWKLDEKTPTTTVKGFDIADLKTYLDFSRFNVTTNTTLDGNLTVHYTTPEGERGEKVFPISVTVVPDAVPASKLSPRELQQARNFPIPLNSLTLLYLALLVLVIINLFLLFRRGGGKEEIVIRPPEVQ